MASFTVAQSALCFREYYQTIGSVTEARRKFCSQYIERKVNPAPKLVVKVRDVVQRQLNHNSAGPGHRQKQKTYNLASTLYTVCYLN